MRMLFCSPSGLMRPLFIMVALLGCAGRPAPAPRAGIAPSTASGLVEALTPPLEGFYAKRIYSGKIPILAHASVSDEALFAARGRLERLLGHAPKVRESLESAKHEVHLIGLRQFASDLPEFRASRGTRIYTGELFDWHMIGGHITGRFSSCTEGSLLPIVGHRLFGTEVCMHELGHAVEMLALDSANRARILTAYQRSLETGHWEKEYAATSRSEWFAEITRYYFHADGDALAFYDPTLSRGRVWLSGYDPEAYHLVDDLYSGRTDPGRRRTVTLRLQPGRNEAQLHSEASRLPSTLTIRNGTTQRIHLVWIDFEGRRDPRASSATEGWADPGGRVDRFTFATHPFVITDEAGHAMCTVIAEADDGIADVTGSCD
jgi:hypothetical protein